MDDDTKHRNFYISLQPLILHNSMEQQHKKQENVAVSIPILSDEQVKTRLALIDNELNQLRLDQSYMAQLELQIQQEIDEQFDNLALNS